MMPLMGRSKTISPPLLTEPGFSDASDVPARFVCAFDTDGTVVVVRVLRVVLRTVEEAVVGLVAVVSVAEVFIPLI